MRAATVDALYKARIISLRSDADSVVPLHLRQLDALDDRADRLFLGLPAPVQHQLHQPWSTRPKPHQWQERAYPVHLVVVIVTWTLAKFVRPGPTPVFVLQAYLKKERNIVPVGQGDPAVHAAVKHLFELLVATLVR